MSPATNQTPHAAETSRVKETQLAPQGPELDAKMRVLLK
jgi:hypothetical protein